MVVIIEDITDQIPPHEPACEEKNDESKASNAPEEEPEEFHDSEEWVNVTAEDVASPTAGLRGDLEAERRQDAHVGGEKEDENGEEEEEITVDPEEFAAQLARSDTLKQEGNKFFAEGNMEEAIDRYSLALEEAPITAPLQRAVYFANRAACHMKLEEYSEAAIDCSAALDLNPTYVKALMRRAGAFEAQQLYDDAIVDLKKVLELEPSNKAASASIARLEPLAEKKREELKDEMIGKLKDLGNMVLGKFGLSVDNFKAEQDPQTGSYSIKFQQ